MNVCSHRGIIQVFAAAFLIASKSTGFAAPVSEQTNFAQITDAEKIAPIHSVVRAGPNVLVMNSYGLYRTRLPGKEWEHLALPPEFRAKGIIAGSLANSNALYLYSPHSGTNDGLYLSHNLGGTWEMMSREYDFLSVFVNSDGRVYAAVWIELKPGQSFGAWTNQLTTAAAREYLLLSTDEGRHWRDISAAGTIMRIFPDSDHPERICFVSNSIRNYVFEAADDDYKSWTSTREWDWRKHEPTDDEFLGGGYATTTALYEFHATLENYFEYPFGDRDWIQAFDIAVETNRLEFATGQKIVIPVTIKFRPENFVVKLPVATNTVEFWRIQSIGPDGERTTASGRKERTVQGKDLELVKQREADGTGFGVVELSSTLSCRQAVCLSDLATFSKPGKYRIRLSFDSLGWGSSGGTSSGIWGGSFSGEVFTLTIRP